ncbi:MAG TPA: hypothetical protein VNO26_05080 [Candidatus Limnocylindria bacterium]|nr:hypothetical protein [Candidatus Limnocylindria bacterium]
MRPFVGHTGQRITLFSNQLVAGETYKVEFASLDTGVTDWSAGKARVKRDLADGALRPQLTVAVPEVPLGPARITVVGGAGVVMQLPDSAFTVAAEPIPLHDFAESITRTGYRSGVGRDGTLYIPVDVSAVQDATSFVAQGLGFKLAFGPADVTMYNQQGFLMQRLDPKEPGLFDIVDGTDGNSHALAYWRHEFRTYHREHRRVRDRELSDEDPAWHEDGTRHVDHDHIVVAIRGTMPDGKAPAPGATPPFTLVLTSTPDER